MPKMMKGKKTVARAKNMAAVALKVATECTSGLECNDIKYSTQYIAKVALNELINLVRST